MRTTGWYRGTLGVGLALAALAWLLATGAGHEGAARAAGACAGPKASLDGEEQGVIALVNAYRAENGLAPVRASAVLNGIAAWTVDDLAASGSFAHTDSLGRAPYARAIACGYPGGAGENLAAGGGWSTAAQAFAAWKASPSHNTNMLSRYYTEIGVARLQREGSRYGWYWATELGANGGAVATASPPPAPAATPTQALPPTPAVTPPPAPALAAPRAAAAASAGESSSPAAPAPASAAARDATPAQQGRAIRILQWAFDASPPASALAGTPSAAAVYAYDAASGSWRYYLPGVHPALNTLGMLEPGADYYVIAE